MHGEFENALVVIGPLASGEIQGYEPVAPLGAAGMIAALSLFWVSVLSSDSDCGACGAEVCPQQQPRDVGRVHARRQPFSPKEKRVFRNFSSGSGGFRGSGGFGGGSFGGGGAGGSW